MRYSLVLSILAALLGGCAVTSAGYDRGDSNYRGRDYNDGIYHKYSYRSGHGNPEEPYRGS